MQNPFSLAFGNSPQMEIDRASVDFDIIRDFNSEHSSSNAYMITGVRGSGKTVYMTDVCKKLRQNKDWIVIEASPENDIIDQVAYKLAKDSDFGSYVVSAKIELSILNVELNRHVEGISDSKSDFAGKIVKAGGQKR